MAPKLQSLALRLSSDCTTWRRIVLQEDCPPVPIVPIVLQEDCHPVSIVPIVPIVLQEDCPPVPIVPIVLQEDCPPVPIVPIVPIVLQEDCPRIAPPETPVPIVPIVLQEVCPRIAPPGGARLLPKNTHNICFSLHYIGGSVDPILWCTVMLNVDSAEPVKSMI